MSLLAFFSTTAIVIGLAAAVPQLAAMVRARSAAGQSSVGWALGASVNGMMSYVNFVGYHATVLALGNVVSVVLCVVAVGLVLRFGTAAVARHHAAVSDLPTHEVHALREELEHEARRRHEHERHHEHRREHRELAAVAA